MTSIPKSEIERIKIIGANESCSNEELSHFLPNYPLLKGNETLFRISLANAKKYIDRDVALLVKGLHFIEEEYKKASSNDFGFGSPSPTYKIIKALQSKDPELAHELEGWVASAGGNYYIS
ncbi:hypothetical protein SAMN02745704_01104 [Paucidesulfovibrio gracilis DSM 16080]|uniref:Uncharacterized protein n=1 Tax=Paucidesulfovibrio gracilis DSM 16080 TaxID=1121449 RepID=A0A1T4WLN5_9BACT|nr:hypothetical protein [Paucidesulfovibrio gracilis]SKA78243.1 hypothetical protein SAMN02745704_01104 [Paucidesulfovibrio gracilis DSM 16080]